MSTESPCLIPAEQLSAQLQQLPRQPGVYLMKDADGRVLYVGKAGVLRNRVRSYFGHQADLAPKTRAMVARVAGIDYIVTGSEKEALLLESNLLKEHRPRYNIKLRDDKQYLYLKIGMADRYPRVYTARRVAADGGRYFGPYTNSQAMRDTIKHLQRLFQFRTCSLDLSKEYKRPCLLYHIKRCSGPCVRQVTDDEYAKSIQELIWFVEGKHDDVLAQLRADMERAADELAFERAASLRDRIAAAEKVAEQQRITTVGRGDLDAIAFAAEDGDVAVQVFTVRDDKIVGREEFVLQDAEGAGTKEILTQFVQQYYDRATYVPPTVLLPEPIDSPDAFVSWLADRRGGRVKLEVPRRGAKKQLLDLVAKNAAEALERLKQKWLADERMTRGAVRELGEALGLAESPRRIECYDISHVQGTSTVASMVVFEDGRPARHAYRRFRIKAGDQNDDFASMYEVITRRFRRAALATEGKAGATSGDAVSAGGGDAVSAGGGDAVVPDRSVGAYRYTPSGGPQTRTPTADALGTRPGVDDVLDDVDEQADDEAIAASIRVGQDARRAERTGEIPADAGEAGLMAPEDDGVDTAAAAGSTRDGWAALPDLVIIDGGKGQLNAALEAMRDVAAPAISTVGLAKEREEIFRPGHSEPLRLARTSQALYLVQRIRDEAHRFAVTYHQLVRKKRMVGSRLDYVRGIGPKRKKELIRRFGSVRGIAQATDEELLAVPGVNAEIVAQLREQL
ncbi:MAG: excinuclease ABC subunit UvrC [Chloroflexi bacterium]|nr:excinuclease ABC subunit UvrC [Chloroflexota bacterium]